MAERTLNDTVLSEEQATFLCMIAERGGYWNPDMRRPQWGYKDCATSDRLALELSRLGLVAEDTECGHSVWRITDMGVETYKELTSVRPMYTRLGSRFVRIERPNDPELDAVVQKSIAACVALGEERDRQYAAFLAKHNMAAPKKTCADTLKIQKSRSGGNLSLRIIVFSDYAELELRAAASMTPEQIAAMRQENDDESNHP